MREAHHAGIGHRRPWLGPRRGPTGRGSERAEQSPRPAATAKANRHGTSESRPRLLDANQAASRGSVPGTSDPGLASLGGVPGSRFRLAQAVQQTAAEVGRLLDACSRTAPTGLRNRALIVILWRGGLRVSEALALTPKDVDRNAGTLQVLDGKGGKQRMVALDPLAFGVIERWLEARKVLPVQATPR